MNALIRPSPDKLLKYLLEIYNYSKMLLNGQHGVLNEDQFEDLEAIQNCVKDAISQTREAFELLDAGNFPALFDVAHDFLTPSANLQGFNSILLEGIDGELNAGQLQIITKIQQMSQMNRVQTYTLIDYARILVDFQVKLQRVALNDLIPTDIDFLLKDTSVSLTYELDENIVDSCSNRLYIIQSVTNLVANAAEYTQSGGHITVSTRQQNDFAIVTVGDNGVGIEPQYHELIFQPFYQIDHARPGLGLGLFITKKFVELQHGQLWFDSDPNKGTTVSFSVPSFNSVSLEKV